VTAAGVLAQAAALIDARQPFALATVVWRRAPSSGRVGAKSIVLADGTTRGWLGGACAEPTVLREALAALHDGRPRLLLLGSADDFPSPSERIGGASDATVRVPMACESEGALEVYVEPFLPRPQLVVVGRSPAVHALTVQARAIDWDVAVVDDGGRAGDHPHPELVRTALDFSGLGIGPSSAIVVATQGHYDDLALDAALHTDAGYVGLVAAEKRASALLRTLRERGFDETQLARVHAPAGLDLGPLDNAEIAVAVLADLVARRVRGSFGAIVVAPPARREARDPVCGMAVFVDDAKYHTVHGGTDYWFCAPGCQRAFEHEPEAFAVADR
jgi:xanthine dehydrogenase accessory factor